MTARVNVLVLFKKIHDTVDSPLRFWTLVVLDLITRTKAGMNARTTHANPIPKDARRQCSPEQNSSSGVVIAFSYRVPKVSCRAKQNMALIRINIPQFLPRFPVYNISAIRAGPRVHTKALPIPISIVARINTENTSANNKSRI